MSLISAALAALSQWNSGIKPPLAPKPYPARWNHVAAVGSQNLIPDTATNDGSTFQLKTGTVTRYSPTGAVVYTVAPTDIDASATDILGIAIDTANQRLYMLAAWGGTNVRLAYTALAAKSLTIRTGQAVTLNATRTCFIRAANGVDFLLYTSQTAAPQTTWVHTITEATGAITAAATFRLSGVDPRISATGQNRGAYVTADQTMVIQIVSGAIWLNRGGGFGVMPWASAGIGTFEINGATQGFLTSGDGLISTWGDGSTTEFLFPKTFIRAEFDGFLQRAADFMGLPR